MAWSKTHRLSCSCWIVFDCGGSLRFPYHRCDASFCVLMLIEGLAHVLQKRYVGCFRRHSISLIFKRCLNIWRHFCGGKLFVYSFRHASLPCFHMLLTSLAHT